jgi:cell division septal protein FtsQ
MRKPFLFWLMFGFAVLVAIYIAARASIVLMGQGGRLSSVRKISVYSSNGEVAAIAARLNIPPGTRRVDLDDTLARITADPDVAKAAVRRMPNGDVRIRAKMRVIVAAWTDGEKYYPLDAEGAPINRPLDARPANTLVFSGKVPSDISGISAALKRAPGLFYRADRLEFIENRRWDIFLLNGIRVMLPEENFEAAIQKIEKMNKQNMILDRMISLLDMRDVARPMVKLSK